MADKQVVRLQRIEAASLALKVHGVGAELEVTDDGARVLVDERPVATEDTLQALIATLRRRGT